MKRIIKAILRPGWKATTSLRRALMSRFDARVVRIIAGTIETRMVPPIVEAISASDARLERIEGLIVRADYSASTMAEEVDLVLNGLSREIFRLQTQVERLRRDVDAGEELRPHVGGLSILKESEGESPTRPEIVPTERSRVG